MSTLSQRLKKPSTWIAAAALTGCLAIGDSCRAPGHQLTARLYVGVVHVYQRVGRPVVRHWVVCRYTPTCSEYSVQAVTKYGIGRGLIMTFRRLRSCTRAVPLGTRDPVT